MMLNGFIQVPISKVQRAMRFAETFATTYDQRNKDRYDEAFALLVKDAVGRRDASRGFGLIKLSRENAEAEAKSRLTVFGSIAWTEVAKVLRVSPESLHNNASRAFHLREIHGDLRVIFQAGHHLDNVVLDLESCGKLQKVLEQAEAERFA